MGRGHSQILFLCAWSVVWSQVGDWDSDEVDKEHFVQLEVWAAPSENTLQGINTGHKKLTNAVRSLGRAMPAHEPIILRPDPVIRYLCSEPEDTPPW